MISAIETLKGNHSPLPRSWHSRLATPELTMELSESDLIDIKDEYIDLLSDTHSVPELEDLDLALSQFIAYVSGQGA